MAGDGGDTLRNLRFGLVFVTPADGCATVDLPGCPFQNPIMECA